MWHLTYDKKKLYYEIHGNPDGDTIVFLNGLTQSTQSWNLMLPYFTERYRVVLLDFIFQGQSEKIGDWRDFEQHAADVKSLLQKINGGKKVFLTGLSYGSLVAQRMAVLYSELIGKLILMSTFACKTPYYEKIEESWWKALEKGGYEGLLDVMLPGVLSRNFFAGQPFTTESFKQARLGLDLSPDALFKLMRATREMKDYRKWLNRIALPALIIQGELDLLFPVPMAEEVQRNIRNSELRVVKNAGHTLNLERVAEVAQLINNFIKVI